MKTLNITPQTIECAVCHTPIDKAEMTKAIMSSAGKTSAHNRFGKKTPKEISDVMRRVRLTRKDKEAMNQMAKAAIKNLRSIR